MWFHVIVREKDLALISFLFSYNFLYVGLLKNGLKDNPLVYVVNNFF